MGQVQVSDHRMGISVRPCQIERGDIFTRDVRDRYESALGGALKFIADFGGRRTQAPPSKP